MDNVRKTTNPFFDYLPVAKIEKALSAAGGNELKSKKIESLESSAALAANTFGLFLDDDQSCVLPPIPERNRLDGRPSQFASSIAHGFRGAVVDIRG